MGSLPDLSSTLSSQARFRVLRALAPLVEGLRLRELERECGLSIRSVQLATRSLAREQVLLKASDGRFRLNGESPVANRLRGLFGYLRDEEVRAQARMFTARARAVIRLSEDMRTLVRTGGR